MLGFSRVPFNGVSKMNGGTEMFFRGLTFLPLLRVFCFLCELFPLCPKSVPDAAALPVMFSKDFSQKLYEHPVFFTLASSSLKTKQKIKKKKIK